MRIRKIKKYGDSYIIRLSPTDIQDFKLEIGDAIDIDNVVFLKKKKEKDKK